jgi:hypothetical protein
MPAQPSIWRRSLGGFLLALFAALLFLPLFAQFTRMPPDKNLVGLRARTKEFPLWTGQAWLNGQFSTDASAWIREHAGLRGWLVALNRQLRYSLFGQLAPAPLGMHAVVIGKAPMLYEKIYLTGALRQPVVPPEKMEAFATSLERVQGILNEHGIAFLVILAPNKALFYADALPGWAQKHVSDENSDFPAFLEALRRHQVAHLDTMSLFRQLRPESPPLVAIHGAHWSFFGAWVAWQHAIPILNREGLLPEIPVPETEELILRPALDMDAELRAQLNLFSSRHADRIPAPYPVAASLPPGKEQMLDALIVGDSYGFGLMDALARSRLCRRIHYWYYMRSIYEVSTGSFDSRRDRLLNRGKSLGRFPPTSENGRRFLEGKNLVLIVLTSFNINKYSWNFNSMVKRLYGSPDASPPPTEDSSEPPEE